MEVNNTTLLKKIDMKLDTMHTEFQTYLMRTTTELVQSFQVKNHPFTNNVAIISLVYDEVTN